jgi:putative ABC transport system permease protein
MHGLLTSLRQGLRRQAREPVFTAGAIVSLALAVGSCTAIFTFVYPLLIQPLPYQNWQELVMLYTENPEKGVFKHTVSSAELSDWKSRNQSFVGMMGLGGNLWSATGEGGPQILHGYVVTPGGFRLLGVEPVLGRSFLPEEEKPGANNVVLLYYGLWQSRYAGDVNVIGKKLYLYEEPFTIIGVLPRGFRLLERQADMLVPLAFDISRNTNRKGRGWPVLARLKPGVSIEQAQSDMDSIARQLEEEYPDSNRGWRIRVVPIREATAGEVRPALLILLGAAGFVLLITSANITSFLLARTTARQKELAIRSALGASRRHVLAQVLLDSLLLGLLGSLAGLPLASVLVRFLLGQLPADNMAGKTIIQLENIRFEPWIGALGLAAGILAMLLFGLVPALLALRTDISNRLKGSAVGTSRRSGGQRPFNLLVVGQVAVALILVVQAGLFVQTLRKLQTVDIGFKPDNVLVGAMMVTGSRYQKPEQGWAVFKTLFERLEALPEVVSAAGLSGGLPMSMHYPQFEFDIKERPVPSKSEEIQAIVRWVTPGYFRTIGTPRLSGRDFRESDPVSEDSCRVIVSQSLARRFIAPEDPVGMHVVFGAPQVRSCEIVGVVGDVLDDGLRMPPRNVIHFAKTSGGGFVMLLVRTHSDPMRLLPRLREELQKIDPDLSLYRLTTLEKLVFSAAWYQHWEALILSGLSALGLLLAALGVYGVMQYSVTRRTHDIGIELALGATPQRILRQVMMRGLRLALVGVGIGLVASLALIRLTESQLYGVEPTDLKTFLGSIATLVLVALVASYAPARQATEVDPVEALRYE